MAAPGNVERCECCDGTNFVTREMTDLEWKELRQGKRENYVREEWFVVQCECFYQWYRRRPVEVD